jgi:carbon monoxide dehydrogenase subunit G
MNIAGSIVLRHNSNTVWESLTNPSIMQESIPGCDCFAKINENQFQADIAFKLSLLSIKFVVSLEILESTPDRHYLFNASGKGGMSGDASGQCNIHLTATDTGSELCYDAAVEIEGMLKKVAEPLIRKKAHGLIEKYFVRFQKAIDENQ